MAHRPGYSDTKGNPFSPPPHSATSITRKRAHNTDRSCFKGICALLSVFSMWIWFHVLFIPEWTHAFTSAYVLVHVIALLLSWSSNWAYIAISQLLVPLCWLSNCLAIGITMILVYGPPSQN